MLFQYVGGCKNEVEPIIQEGFQIAGSHLKVDAILAYLPAKLDGNSRVIYKAEDGCTKNLSVFRKEEVVERTSNDVEYTSDQVNVTLNAGNDNDFHIELIANSNYSYDETSVLLSLIISLTPYSSLGSTSGFIDFEDEEPLNIYTDFYSQIELNEKTFSDCFLLTDHNPDEHSEIYINSIVGIVAFRDVNNDLFVFEEFQ